MNESKPSDLIQNESAPTDIVPSNTPGPITYQPPTPMQQQLAPLTQAMLNGTLDVEKVKMLQEIQRNEEAAQAERAFNSALAQFKSNPLTLKRDRTVDYSTSKGRTTYNHTSLGYALSVVNPILSKYELSLSWRTVTEPDGTIIVTCRLSHAMGHFEETSLPGMPDQSGGKNDIQAVGSTVTYLKRYTAFSLLGLESEDADNDGAKGAGGDTVEYISDGQAKTIRNLIKQTESDEAKFCTAIKAESVERINVAGYHQAVNMLKKKLQGANNAKS